MRVVSKSRTIGLDPGSRSWIRLWSEGFTLHNSKILIWWTLSCLVILLLLWPNAQIVSKLLLEKEATSWLLLTVCFLPYCPNSEGHSLHLRPFFMKICQNDIKICITVTFLHPVPWYCESIVSPSRLAYARGSCVTIILFTRPSTVTMTVTWLQTQSCLLKKKILSLYAVFSSQIEDAEYTVWTRTPSFLLPYRNQEVLQSIGRVEAVAIEGLSLKDIPHRFQPSARAVPLCSSAFHLFYFTPRRQPRSSSFLLLLSRCSLLFDQHPKTQTHHPPACLHLSDSFGVFSGVTLWS